MARKVMRTIADVRDELTSETLSTQPLLTNDYTYGNLNEMKDMATARIEDKEERFDEIDAEEAERNIIDNQPKATINEGSSLEDCGCGIGEGAAQHLINEREQLSQKYPVQQAVSTHHRNEYTVDEIQDSVDEINVDPDTRERG